MLPFSSLVEQRTDTRLVTASYAATLLIWHSNATVPTVLRASPKPCVGLRRQPIRASSAWPARRMDGPCSIAGCQQRPYDAKTDNKQTKNGHACSALARSRLLNVSLLPGQGLDTHVSGCRGATAAAAP